MTDVLRRMWTDDDGQDLVEYALIAVLISLAVFAALQAVGTQLNVVWNKIVTALS